MLAFSNDYYGIIFRATQSVELFCAYNRKTSRHIKRGARFLRLLQICVHKHIPQLLLIIYYNYYNNEKYAIKQIERVYSLSLTLLSTSEQTLLTTKLASCLHFEIIYSLVLSVIPLILWICRIIKFLIYMLLESIIFIS